MADLDLDIPIIFKHCIRFSKNVFNSENDTLKKLFPPAPSAKAIIFIENEIIVHFPQIEREIKDWFSDQSQLTLTNIVRAEGGEYCKRSETVCREVMDAIEKDKVDRHSYVWVIGGGAFLDVVGFAAATAHRGIRLVRFPTTTLSQDDSGVGVKNGINLYKKKNFLGTFAVPYAVVNDFRFLYSQPEQVCREGLVEAIKVALVKDANFFFWMESNIEALAQLEPSILETTVIHKAEQLSDFRLTHAQAVSIGLVLDTMYAWRKGFLSEDSYKRVISLLKGLKLPLWDDSFSIKNPEGRLSLLDGLDEFREHLGGQLTIMLLREIGEGFDVHEMDADTISDCISEMEAF